MNIPTAVPLLFTLLLLASGRIAITDSRWPSLPTVHPAPDQPPVRNATLHELLRWHSYTNGTSPYYCLNQCCWRYNAVTWPFRGLLPGKVARSDLLSPITNRGLADLVYHKRLPLPPEKEQLSFFQPEYIECIQATTVVWVDTTELPDFFENVLPKLRVPIVLVSGDSDNSAPKSFLTHLHSRKILHWLAMNCDMPAATTPKLSCLPLGVSQWYYKDQSDKRFLDIMAQTLDQGIGLQQGVLPSPHHPKQKLLLVAFSVASNSAARQPAWQHACEGPLREVATCGKDWTLEETYRETAEHAFVLAPEGTGVDTYRAWETLYLGSYPVVQSNTLASQYVGLPVLVVENWQELTVELLQTTYEAFRSRQWNYERLYLGHYFEALGHFRSGINKEYRVSYHLKAQ